MQKKSYDDFSIKFKDSSDMVPEWKKYYDQSAVEKIGTSLDSGMCLRFLRTLEKWVQHVYNVTRKKCPRYGTSITGTILVN